MLPGAAWTFEILGHADFADRLAAETYVEDEPVEILNARCRRCGALPKRFDSSERRSPERSRSSLKVNNQVRGDDAARTCSSTTLVPLGWLPTAEDKEN